MDVNEPLVVSLTTHVVDKGDGILLVEVDLCPLLCLQAYRNSCLLIGSPVNKMYTSPRDRATLAMLPLSL